MSTQAHAHTYTIKEVSDLTGLPASTLRYYESIGIMKPVERDPSSKQRIYSQEDLNILDAIACLNATGMSINDMRTYIGNRNRGAEGARGQIGLLASQKRQLAAEAKAIKIRQQYVNLKIDYWHAVESGDDAKAQVIGAEAKKLAKLLKTPQGR